MHSLLQKVLSYLSFRLPKEQLPKQSPTPQKTTKSPTDGASDLLQREIRAQRKFSLAEAIGREGGSFMKGESTIPRPLRATAAINQFITTHLSDPTSAFSTTIQAWVKDDIRVSRQLDTPLVALAQIIESLLTTPTTFEEFSRQVAIAHSHLTGERPYFHPHPDVAYTYATIRQTLSQLLIQLQPPE